MSLSYYRSEGGVLERIRNREAAAAYRQSAAPTESFSQRVQAIYDAYPHMPGGQIVAFASDPTIDITSPEFQEIANASFDVERKSGVFDRIGDAIGGIKSAAGTVLGPIGRGVDTALGSFDENVNQNIRAGVRTGFVVLESGLQEGQTFIRNAGWAGVRTQDDLGADNALERLGNLVNPANWDDFAANVGKAYGEVNAGGSSGREVVSKLLRGEDVDLGSGFLPAGTIESDVKARANRLTMKVNGVQYGGPGNQSITVGRALAAQVSEPGDTAYNVISGLADAGVAWFGDPASALGGLAHSARASQRVGRAGRAVREGRGLVGAAEELATNPGFTKVVDRSLQARAAEGLGDLIDDLTGRLTSAEGGRNTVQPDVFAGWLAKGGRSTVERIAETTDFYDLWQATGKKMPVALTRRLADAATPQDVERILDEAVGVGLREAPEFLGFKVKRAHSQGFRMAQDMPSTFIDPNDLDQAAEQLDRWLRNAKVTPELRRSAVDRLVRNDQPTAAVTLMGEIMGDVADELVDKIRPLGLRRGTADAVKTSEVRKRARRLTTMFNQDVDALRAFASDEIIENARVNGVVLGDDFVELGKPHLLTEYLNSVIPLPEPREIRRATSALNRLVDNPFFTSTTGGLNALSQQWKKVALMRGAYTVRVVGEEQVRMAASGLDSMFAHPISFISALVADPNSDSAFRRFIGAPTGKRRQSDVFGDDFFDEGMAATDDLGAALNKRSGGWLDESGVVLDRNHILFKPEDEGYTRAWAVAIGEAHRDIVVRKVAEGRGNLTDVKEWFYNGQGRRFRRDLIAGGRDELAEQAASDAYIESLHRLLKDRTGDDPTLLEAIATGKIGDVKIGSVTEKGRYGVAPELMAHLDDVVGPAAVKGQRVLAKAVDDGRWNRATDFAFTYLMTKPTNYLSRSPSFRQRYWQRIEEQLPYMDDATRAKAMAAAEGVVDKAQMKRIRQAAPSARRKTVTKRVKNGAPSERFAKMTDDEFAAEYDRLDGLVGAAEKSGNPADFSATQRGMLDRGEWEAFSRSRGYTEQEISDFREWLAINGDDLGFDYSDVAPAAIQAQHRARAATGGTSLVDEETHLITELDDADLIAKSFALDETKKLLYDMTEKGQFFDAARLIFPFGEAWKEVITRWAKIGMENPRAIRRGQQIINGARGSGFFHKDTNGEEVFTFPLSSQISNTLIGIPVPLKGRVAGLSLMTEVLPGVGPVVQVSAAAFMPDESEWNWAREFINPYGDPDYTEGFVESFFPGWLKNASQAFGAGNARQRAATIRQVYDSLRSTGDYDVSTPEGQAKLMEDAIAKGKQVFALRALAQFVSPTSPLPDIPVDVDEREGYEKMMSRREVAADLYKLEDELGYEEGIAAFVDRYGVDMLAVTQGVTKPLAPVLPISSEAGNWVRDNRDIVKDYKQVWGMFAPDDTENPDFTEFGRQIADGSRKALTVEEQVTLANAKVGRYIFEHQESLMPEDPTTEQREWLAAVKDQIRQEYPGYGELTVGAPFGADLDAHVIPELRRALLDPRLAATRQAKALRTYLAARDQALAYAEAEYGTKLGSQAAAPLRQWLRQVAQHISTGTPEFEGVFDRAFSYELDV